MASSSSAPSTHSPIPLLYRIVFTYIDPLFCILGFYTHIFTPGPTASGYGSISPSTSSPSPNTPVAIGTQHMLDNLAAFFIFLFVVEGVLLRARSHDPTVWRIVQAGGFLLDVVMTLGAVRQLSAQGRLYDVGRYEGDDFHHVFGNAGMGVIRLACALGLGMGSGTVQGVLVAKDGSGSGKKGGCQESLIH